MDITSTLTTLLRDGFILVFNQDKLDIVKTAEALIKAGINNSPTLKPITGPLARMASMIKAPNRMPNVDLPGMWRGER